MVRELLIGCGKQRKKVIYQPGKQDFENVTTLDINPDHNPDVVWDLNNLPLPFEDNTFDEIHAYEVMEHVGQQGDYKFFFAQFTDFWRMLKDGGYFFATCPLRDSKWAWGDPSHTRIVSRENLTYLFQKEYEDQVGSGAMTDFRYLYKADWKPVLFDESEDSFQFAMEAIK